jgi:beta-phosphoglucomutase-like phosphatase (HAD superfamily)
VTGSGKAPHDPSTDPLRPTPADVGVREAVIAYASSGQPDDVRYFRELIGADEWVDEVVDSSEVEASKPDPDISPARPDPPWYPAGPYRRCR